MENLGLYLSDDAYLIPDIMLICDRQRIKNDKYRGVPRFISCRRMKRMNTTMRIAFCRNWASGDI